MTKQLDLTSKFHFIVSGIPAGQEGLSIANIEHLSQLNSLNKHKHTFDIAVDQGFYHLYYVTIGVLKYDDVTYLAYLFL